MATRVFENGIATHYTIEYKLNEKDMEFYKKACGAFYIQAAFVNDAISKLNKPINETCIKLSESDSKGLDNSLECEQSLESNYSAVFVTDVSPENYTYSYVAVPRFDYTISHQHFHSKTESTTILTMLAPKFYNGIYDIPSSAHMILEYLDVDYKNGIFYNVQDYDWGIKDNMNNYQ